MGKKYDLIVIGTGSAATLPATRCRAAGLEVAIIDHRPFGGTCALRGCDPKKVFMAAAEAVDGIERMSQLGIVNNDRVVDWAALQRFKRSFTDSVPDNREKMFAEKGIAMFHGKARFIGPQQLLVGEEELHAERIVVATGAEPAELPIEGSEYLTLSDEYLELDVLPQRLVMVGGGFIAFEFAHVAARAGAEVTILNRGVRPLKQFEPELVEALVNRSKDIGIKILDGHEVNAITCENDEYTVHTNGPEADFRTEADCVVHSGGRVPAVADLDLDTGNVVHDKFRIERNEYLQSTSNPAVYITGDAGSPPQALTPVAALEAKAVAENLLSGNQRKVDYSGIPAAVFTVPTLARVGLTEKEAKDQGFDFKLKQESVSNWYSARRMNESCYSFKVLVEEETDRILGAHIVGPNAADIVNIFGFAIRTGLKASDLASATFAYPSAASDLEYMLP